MAEPLPGRKTYLLVAAGLLVTLVNLVGLLPDETWTKIMALLGFGSAGTLRAAIAQLREAQAPQAAWPQAPPPPPPLT